MLDGFSKDLGVTKDASAALTEKLDATQTTPAHLGSNVIWTKPQLKPIETDRKTGLLLARSAELTVFFFPEVDLR